MRPAARHAPKTLSVLRAASEPLARVKRAVTALVRATARPIRARRTDRRTYSPRAPRPADFYTTFANGNVSPRTHDLYIYIKTLLNGVKTMQAGYLVVTDSAALLYIYYNATRVHSAPWYIYLLMNNINMILLCFYLTKTLAI